MRILTTLCFVLSAFLSSAQYQVLPRTVDTLTVCDTNTMVVRFKCIVPGSFSTRFHLSRLSVAYPTGSYELSSPGFAIAQAGNAEYLISDTLPHQAGDTVVLPLRLIPNCNTIPNNDVSGTASLTTAFRFGTVSDSITHLCLYSNFSFNGSQTLTFNPNSVTPLKAVFKNNTGTAFHGYFHWNWLRPNVACDTFFKLSTEVRVQVFDSLGVSLAPPRAFATLFSGSYFNGGSNPPAVPPGGSLIVSVADTTIANCSAFTALNVGCPFVLSAAWGCSAVDTCFNKQNVQFNFVKAVFSTIIEISRITPDSVGIWDNSCVGTETNWAFLIRNKDSVQTAVNCFAELTQDVGGALPAFTRIRRSSLELWHADASGNVFTATPQTLVNVNRYDSLQFGVLADTLKGNGCISLPTGDFWLRDCKLFLGTMPPKDAYVLRFTTYRCCPKPDTPYFSNTLTGIKATFNHWNAGARFTLGCYTAQEAASPVSKLKYDPDSTGPIAPVMLYPVLMNPPQRGISAQASLISQNPDLVLQQSHQQQNVGIRDDNPSVDTCSPDISNTIKNVQFPGELSDGGDFQLFTSTPSGFPSGRFALVYHLQPNLVCGDTAPFIFHPGYSFKWPASSYFSGMRPAYDQDSFTRGYAEFDLKVLRDSLVASGIAQPQIADFNAFFLGSEIRYFVKGCCPLDTNYPTPKAFMRSYFSPQPQSECPTCFIPLEQRTFQYVLFCPGCVTPGLITSSLVIERQNYGYRDANDDGRAEVDAQGQMLLANDSTYSRFGDLNRTASIAGDQIHLKSIAHFFDGEGPDGYSYASWRSCDTAKRLHDLYLQLTVFNGDSVDFTAMPHFGQTDSSLQISVTRNGVTSTAIGHPFAVLKRGAKRLIYYHFTDAQLGNFQPGETYHLDGWFHVCKNPERRQDLLILHYLMLANGVSESSISNAGIFNSDLYSNAIDAGASNGQNHGHPCITAPMAIGNTAADTLAHARIFICEPRAAFHTVYPIVVSAPRERWYLNSAKCHQYLGMNTVLAVQDNGLSNLFSYEIRPIPTDISNHLQQGPWLGNSTDPWNFHVNFPNGYRGRFKYFYTAATAYSGRLTTGYAVSTLPFDSSRLSVRKGLLRTAGNLHINNSYLQYGYADSGAVMVQTDSVQFSPYPQSGRYVPEPQTYFDPLNLSFWSSKYFTDTFKTNNGNLPALLLGDEYFEQGVVTEVLPTCTDTVKPYAVRQSDFYSTISDVNNSCNGGIVKANVTAASADTLQRPKLQVLINTASPIFAGDTIRLPIAIQTLPPVSQPVNDQANFFVQISVPVPCPATAQLPIVIDSEKISLLRVYDNTINSAVPPVLVQYDTVCYLTFNLRYNTVNAANYRIDFRFNECRTGSIRLPVYYGWSCDDNYPRYDSVYHSFGNTCMGASLIQVPNTTFSPPQAQVRQLTRDTLPRPAICRDTATLTYRLYFKNDGAGGVGNMLATMATDTNVWVCTSAVLSTAAGSRSLAVRYRNGMYIDSILTLSNFTATSFFGTTGVADATGNVLLTLKFKPKTCMLATPSFLVKWYYQKYCSLGKNDSTEIFMGSTAADSCMPVLNNSKLTICKGDTARLSVQAVSGSSFSWSNGSTSASIAVVPLSSIIYTVTVSRSGCSVVLYDTVTVNNLPNAAITPNGGNICANTSKLLTASGGGGYVWSTGCTKDTCRITPAAVGSYAVSVTVTDNNGCKAVGSATFTVKPLPVVSFRDSNTCYGQSNGVRWATVSGGTPLYQYSWSSGEQTSSIVNKPYGYYTLTVTDANQCVTVKGDSLRSLPPYTGYTIGRKYAGSLCMGQTDSLSIAVAKKYLWNTGDTTQKIRIAPLVTTSYSVTLTNNFGCTQTVSLPIVVDSSSCCVFDTSLTVVQNNLLKQPQNALVTKLMPLFIQAFPQYASSNGSQYYLKNFPYPISFTKAFIIDAPLTIENSQLFFSDSTGYMYIPINTPNVTLTLKGAVLRACGEKMWKGIEILPSGGRVIIGADALGHRTEIWDADIGIAMRTNSPIYHIDSTDFINNRVGMYMNGYKPLESSLKRSRFFTSAGTAMKRVTGPNVASYNDMPTNKMLYGVQLYNTNGHQIGVANCNEEPNRFYNLYCGVYAQLSEIYAVHNSFEGLRDTVWDAPFYGCGIYANGNIGNTLVQRILIGDGTDCGKNYFYANRFGINLNNNDAGDTILISNNKFLHAAKADINVNSAKNLPLIDISYNLMDTGDLAGDGVRLLGCVNSGIYVHHNFIRSVPLSSTYTAANPFPKRVCGIVVVGRASNVANRGLKIYENYITQAIYGIYSLNNKFARIFNNSVSTRQVPYLRSQYTSVDSSNRFSDNVGIMSTYDDSTAITSNSVSIDGPIGSIVPRNSLQNKVTSIAVNSSVKNAQVYCNTTSGAHWGILGLGTNTGGVDMRNNRLQGHQAGIAIFGTNATIGNQGLANCPTSTGTGGTCPLATCPCTITNSNQYTPDNSWVSCVFPLGIYAYGLSQDTQQILMRDGGTLPTGWNITELNPALNSPNSCANPNASNSSLNQDFASNVPQSKFLPRCVSIQSSLNAYNINSCSTYSGPTAEAPKFQMAQLDWWERIATNRDTFTDYVLAEDVHHWRRNELLELLIEYPEMRDSSKVLDSFYMTNASSNVMLQLQAIHEQAISNTDSNVLANLIVANSTIYPTTIQESNLQKLNSIYLNYFVNYLGTSTMPDSIKQKLFSLASQCYVTGGPSVFMARSLYWTFMNDLSWQFQDDCILSTGFFKTDGAEHLQKNKEELWHFKVYPNPNNGSGVLTVSSSVPGELKITNSLGESILKQTFGVGNTNLSIAGLSAGVYFYSAELSNSKREIGKLIITRP